MPHGGPVLVIFVGGAADATVSGLVAGFRERDEAQDTAWRTSRSFAWDQAAEIEALIRSQPPETRIRLVGHSYGCDTAARVAENTGALGRPLDMLVTIDPVGRTQRWARPDFMYHVQAGARRWINVNATGASRSRFSNTIAGMGGAWNYAAMGQANVFINAPFNHGQFTQMMLNPLKEGRSVWQEVAAP